jgi:hypothetical protein
MNLEESYQPGDVVMITHHPGNWASSLGGEYPYGPRGVKFPCVGVVVETYLDVKVPSYTYIVVNIKVNDIVYGFAEPNLSENSFLVI